MNGSVIRAATGPNHHAIPVGKSLSPHARLAGQLLFAAAILIYSAGQLWQNIVWPPFFSFDETLEIDYVYQITQGHLPTFFGGPQFNPFHADYSGAVQWRYQHPPLFYLLEVPVFLIFDTIHHPIRGIWAMRVLVYLLGIALIVASRWAAQWIAGRESAASMLMPLIVASNRCLPSVVLNYTLSTLWVTLLIGMTAQLLRTLPHRYTTRQIAWWMLIVALAPLTRLSTVPIMALCLLVLLIGMMAASARRIRDAMVMVLAPGTLAVLFSGWFYVRLHRLSGNFTGSQPQWAEANLHRNIHITFAQALANPDFYKHAMSQYQNSSVTATSWGWAFVWALTLVPLGLGTFGICRWLAHAFKTLQASQSLELSESSERASHARADIAMIALLLCAFGGTFVQQVLFYKQGGSDNAVYFSLISFVFASIIAVGFTQWVRHGRLWAAMAGVWLLIRLIAFLYEAHRIWPFRTKGILEGAGPALRIGAWTSVAASCVGTAIALACLSRLARLLSASPADSSAARA
jgi:hypothetical protein